MQEMEASRGDEVKQLDERLTGMSDATVQVPFAVMKTVRYMFDDNSSNIETQAVDSVHASSNTVCCGAIETVNGQKAGVEEEQKGGELFFAIKKLK